MNLHLLTCIGGNNIALARQFFDHYKELGVQNFIVILHYNNFSELEENLLLLKSLAVSPVVTWRMPFDVNLSQVIRATAIATADIGSDDWVVLADLDEFQIYPSSIELVIEKCEISGFDYIIGKFVDRIAADGTLPEIDPIGSVWNQFPVCCHISRDLLGATDIKVVCCKAGLIPGEGNHRVAGGKRGAQCKVEIHHFKWDRTVKIRLEARYEHYRNIGIPWAGESLRFLRHFKKHGRISVPMRKE
jgi:hypothetical protein